MNQKERILNSSLPTFQIGEAVYKGKNPEYHWEAGIGWYKVSPGVPFVRVDKK